VDRVLADLDAFSAAARRRAVERFSLGPWLDRHATLFADLAATSRHKTGVSGSGFRSRKNR
jgi:hypothetical protein